MGMNASATKLAVLVLPIAVFASAISVATAQTVAPSNVAQRQDGMKAMANAAKSINAMFKDTSPYYAKAFRAAAETVSPERGLARMGADIPDSTLVDWYGRAMQALRPLIEHRRGDYEQS